MDYYKILGVNKDATDVQIKKAYRKLAIKWHPDKNKDNKEEAEKKFKEVAEAYQVLSDKDQRKKYDMFGKNGLNNNFRPNMDGFHFKFNNGRGDGSFPFSPEDIFRNFFGTNNVFDINDDLDNFNRGFNINRRNRRNSRRKKKKGDSVYYDINCTLEDLFYGSTKRFKITRKIFRNDRLEKENEIISINIQPGWKEGTKITFEEKGDCLPNLDPGDVIFVIKELPHSIFRKDGSNLYITCNITLKEALMGFNRSLRTLDREAISFVIDKLKSSKQTHTIKGKGMPIRKNGKNIGYGDLIIEFDIDLTKK